MTLKMDIMVPHFAHTTMSIVQCLAIHRNTSSTINRTTFCIPHFPEATCMEECIPIDFMVFIMVLFCGAEFFIISSQYHFKTNLFFFVAYFI
jgi:hypothetical protein